jgi:hypothetical protein
MVNVPIVISSRIECEGLLFSCRAHVCVQCAKQLRGAEERPGQTQGLGHHVHLPSQVLPFSEVRNYSHTQGPAFSCLLKHE